LTHLGNITENTTRMERYGDHDLLTTGHLTALIASDTLL